MWVMFAARSRAPIAAAATTVVRNILRDGLVSEEQGADRGRHDDSHSHKHSFRLLFAFFSLDTCAVQYR
jgi:hypothetical protein